MRREALARDRGIAMNSNDVRTLVVRKGERMQDLLRSGSVLFPGAVAFIREAAGAVPIAIASGAMRHEIDQDGAIAMAPPPGPLVDADLL